MTSAASVRVKNNSPFALVQRMRSSSRSLRLAGGAQEFFVVAEIIGLFKVVRSEHHADRPGREIVYVAPDHRADVETVVRAIQVKLLFRIAVVKLDVETAGHGDDKLL